MGRNTRSALRRHAGKLPSPHESPGALAPVCLDPNYEHSLVWSSPAGFTDAAVRQPTAIPQSGKRVNCRGWCRMHYMHWQRTGSTDAAPPPNQGECAVEGCTNEAEKRGLCRAECPLAAEGGSGTD